MRLKTWEGLDTRLAQSNSQDQRGRVLELSVDNVSDVGKWNILQFLDRAVDEVVFDRDESIVSQQHELLPLQIPVIYPASKNANKSHVPHGSQM